MQTDPMQLPRTVGQYAKTRLAHEAMMLQDAQKLLSLNREGLKAHHEQTNGKAPMESEDVINIGDQVIHNHPAQPSQGLGKLATAGLIGAALIGGGAGTVGVTNYLQQPAPPAKQQQLEPQEFEIEWHLTDGKMEMSKPKRIQ